MLRIVKSKNSYWIYDDIELATRDSKRYNWTIKKRIAWDIYYYRSYYPL